jgi:hypothetical protein
MNSVEKVRRSMDAAENVADSPEAEPAVKAAAGLLAMGRGYVDQMIPTDPDELDELLDKGVDWLQSLRSDDE